MSKLTEQDHKNALHELLEKGYKAKKLRRVLDTVVEEFNQDREEQVADFEMGRRGAPEWYEKWHKDNMR